MLKEGLGRLAGRRRAAGVSILIYHRIGGRSSDELDVAAQDFVAQVEHLSEHRVSSLDDAVDALTAGDTSPRVVLTFDDGFGEVFSNAWPVLREHRMPFTVYLATAYVGASMSWPGSTAKDRHAPGLTWEQLRVMVESGLCTVGNHTHTHARPEDLSEQEIDQCSTVIERHLGVTARHFAYTWGIAVPRMDDALRARFRSAVTGALGRNLPARDLMGLARIPVRGSDPLPFFRAKFRGDLGPERTYRAMVTSAKRVRLS